MLARLAAEPEDGDDGHEGDGPMATHDDPPDPRTLHRPDGPPSALPCPECRGPLWELTEGALTRYRCRVGHAYSEETMVAEHAAGVEAALWTAIEVLEERAELLRKVAARARPEKPGAAGRLEEGARDALKRATIIREVLVAPPAPVRGRGRGWVRPGDRRAGPLLRRPARVPQALARLRLHAATSGRASSGASGGAWRRSGCQGFGDYLDYLEVHPDEYEQLFNTLLINVTEFFRDPPAWEHLRTPPLPEILAGKPTDEPVRVWSAGCATRPGGVHGRDGARGAARRGRLPRAREDLRDGHRRGGARAARHAIYTRRRSSACRRTCATRYFERVDQRYAFRKDLRRTLIFGRNNLIADAPISRLDLLICRNTLMYLNAETQARILRHFHFALRDPGVLMLGKSEMMIPTAISSRRATSSSRIFRQAAPPDACRRGSPAWATASAGGRPRSTTTARLATRRSTPARTRR